MAPPAEKYPPLPTPPATPTVEEWRAMSPEARAQFVIEVNTILSDPLRFMGEGLPHSTAKRRAMDRLRKHFDAIGRVIFLAEEFSVLYPGEPGFTPDILAVRDVPEREDDERMAWVVADEGRGIDLVIEIVYEGHRKKDLVDNVERYARLGIPEYFVYDRKKQDLLGYRLPSPEARRYQRIIPQGGLHTSSVLGLDLAVVGGKLEFFYGNSAIASSEDLIARLQVMVGSVEAKAERAKVQAEQAEAKAEQAQTKAEQAITSLQDSVLAIARARAIPCSDDERARIRACDDPALLQRWLVRVATSTTLAEALADHP